MATIERTMMVTMTTVLMMSVLAQVVVAMVPQKTQCCPLCEECFYTYDELYAHFTTAHPAEPIDIIWE